MTFSLAIALVLSQAAPTTVDLSTTLTAFGIASPAISILVWLLFRNEKKSEAKDDNLVKVNERLFDYQERYGPILVQVVETLKDVTTLLVQQNADGEANRQATVALKEIASDLKDITKDLAAIQESRRRESQ